MSTEQFLALRGQKIFQCNFAAGPVPQEFLGTAVGGLRGIVDKFTGRAVWNVAHQPLPLPGKPGAFYVFATATYSVASISGSVGLTLGALPEGMAGTTFLTVFEDSMGWDIGTAEMSMDTALQVISRFLGTQFPLNGGWRMTKGLWRFQHRFAAPEGVPPPPPSPEPEPAGGGWPEDFFTHPVSSRRFTGTFWGISGDELLQLVAGALQEAWRLDASTELVNGVPLKYFIGDNLAWSGQALGTYFAIRPKDEGIFLFLSFADSRGWSAPEAQSALQYSVNAIVQNLQTRISGATLTGEPN
ncbi:MAG: hypothetical protein ACKV0T_16040 [Planctomycetales bacterium]